MPDPASFRRGWFHARDYGLMVANPFERSVKKKGEPARLVVRAGRAVPAPVRRPAPFGTHAGHGRGRPEGRLPGLPRRDRPARERGRQHAMIAGMQWIDVVVHARRISWASRRWGSGRSARSAACNDFFMPRRFGTPMMIMHAFGTGTSSDQAVIVASATFKHGLSGIWYQWMWLFATPFYWLIAPIMRRFRAVTTADVLTLRYDQSVAILFALVGIANMAIKIGVLLKGSGALIDACTGGTIDTNLALALDHGPVRDLRDGGGAGRGDRDRLRPGDDDDPVLGDAAAPVAPGGRRDGRHPRGRARPGDAVAGGAGARSARSSSRCSRSRPWWGSSRSRS